ncbi:MAG: ester cyclase [Hyphomicrobiales bacterium]|nr:ester cyclase [Hyphomicrobiales bacterium]
MRCRCVVLGVAVLGAAALLGPAAASAATSCPSATPAEAVGAALVDKYVASINAHDTSTFPELFTDGYQQHSGRSPDGLAAQVENFRRVFAATPDHRVQVDDCIIAGDRVVARTTHTATHTGTFRGIPPTGKPFTYRTIDIWRVEHGKFAEHWDLTDAADVLRELSAK